MISAVLPIPGHLIVPDCFCPGRGTQTCDSGTVPVIPGQLVMDSMIYPQNIHSSGVFNSRYATFGHVLPVLRITSHFQDSDILTLSLKPDPNPTDHIMDPILNPNRYNRMW